jgi:hypothetical protein
MPNVNLAAGEAVPPTEPYTLDDAHIDTMDLVHQMQAAYDIVHEMDYGVPGINRNTELDHLASVMRVTLQKSKQVAADVDRMERPVASSTLVSPVIDVRAKSFELICEMEVPLATIVDLLRMINITCIADGVFNDMRDTCAVQRTGWLANQLVEKVESLRGELFHMNHANQDGVERESV